MSRIAGGLAVLLGALLVTSSGRIRADEPAPIPIRVAMSVVNYDAAPLYYAPCGPLYDLDGVFGDPQVRYLDMVKELPHALRGSVRVVGSGISLSDTPVDLRHAAPELGADNAAVLGR
jgi:hypothetical protein